MPKKGDYVIATKYSDGDPCDHFAVGIFEGKVDGRYFVSGNDGQMFRNNGFRKVKKITPAVGALIVENIPLIERSGVSVWKWVKEFETSNKRHLQK